MKPNKANVNITLGYQELMETLFTTASLWEQLQCPSADEETNGVSVPCVSFAPQLHIQDLFGFKIKFMTPGPVGLSTHGKTTHYGRVMGSKTSPVTRK